MLTGRKKKKTASTRSGGEKKSFQVRQAIEGGRPTQGGVFRCKTGGGSISHKRNVAKKHHVVSQEGTLTGMTWGPILGK